MNAIVLRWLTAMLLCLNLSLLGRADAAADTALEIIPVQHRPASEILPLIAPLLQPDEAMVASDQGLITQARTQRLPQLRALVERLDRPLQNLILQVRTREGSARQESGLSSTLRIENGGLKVYGGGQAREDSTAGESRLTLRLLEGSEARLWVGQIESRTHHAIALYPGGMALQEISQETPSGRWLIVRPQLRGDRVFLDITPVHLGQAHNGQREVQQLDSQVSGRLGEWIPLAGWTQRLDAGHSTHAASTQENGWIELRVEPAP